MKAIGRRSFARERRADPSIVLQNNETKNNRLQVLDFYASFSKEVGGHIGHAYLKIV
jgi:hypothetical protein